MSDYLEIDRTISYMMAERHFKDYKAGLLTKDKMRENIVEALKEEDLPYLEKLQELGLGSIIWRWKK